MSAVKSVSVFLAEDHLISRMGLKMLIEQSDNFKVVGEAEDGETAVAKVIETKPHVVMMDLGLPIIDGVEATSRIKAVLPNTKVLIFTTAEDDSSIFAALKAGADGYCLKTISAELLAVAIHSVLNGAAWLDPGIANKVLRAQGSQQNSTQATDLSDSKFHLLSLLEQGKGIDEISKELNVDQSKVKGMLDDLLSQLKGATSISSAQKTESGPISLKPGDMVGEHYQIDSCIGQGGMGAVFKASHSFIQRTVAIKTLHQNLSGSSDIIERFKVEAQANASVVHQNLVTIYDFGLIQSKLPYIVMEFIDGESLESLLDRQGLVSVDVGKRIFAQVCDALQAVHSKGIVHRDLKPANVMLLKTDSDPHFVKVVDFGIAKILDRDKANLTQTGECLGSPMYMSPEQCRGSGNAVIDHRCDLYALGCMMYEAFAGMPMFNGNSIFEIVLKHVESPPSKEPLENARLPKGVIDLILSLTEKKAADRPSSAATVRNAILSV